MPTFYIEIGSGKGGIDKVEADRVMINALGWLLFYQIMDYGSSNTLVGYPPDGPGKPKKFWKEGHMLEKIDNEGDG